ncbi:tyrosine-type recombinase/integrase [Halomicroarcula sp. F13]|uniref:Tyrosine-type recombinase/integrase n=1 Tax=Haloarcula rubra TaxID=2487747 RepID=A0AAW4PUA2_9EURY|nr:tyrosine-type recombinase/integrase [Halomicroarcula rubra]
MYIDARQDELSEATLQSQEYRLEAFREFCDEEDIDNLNDLTGRDLYAYRVWRREGNGLDREPIEPITLRGQLATVRSFLRFAAEVDAVPEDLQNKVPLPTVNGGAGVSATTLEPDRADEILDYLRKFEYASKTHVIVLLLWHTGARMGGIRALDVDDCHLDDDNPGVEFVNRPDTDTPLKNKDKGQRWNAINHHVADVLRDYIDGPRHSVFDEYGRRPLITTTNGRASRSTIRSAVYKVTRPCWRGEECPHDRDPEDCDATARSLASKCPSARSPHDVRSGRVTSYRREDVPRRVVSDRLNASDQILDKHYDRRGEREKSEQRRDYLPDS